MEYGAFSVSFCITHAPQCFIQSSWCYARQSLQRVSQASPPAAPVSLNQSLIGGQSRQHEGSLSKGATRGKVETVQYSSSGNYCFTWSNHEAVTEEK